MDRSTSTLRRTSVAILPYQTQHFACVVNMSLQLRFHLLKIIACLWLFTSPPYSNHRIKVLSIPVMLINNRPVLHARSASQCFSLFSWDKVPDGLMAESALMTS